MNSVCDALVVVLVATTGPDWLPVLKFTLTAVTHSSGTVVLQVTLAAGVGPSTLSAITVIVEESAAVYIIGKNFMQ